MDFGIIITKLGSISNGYYDSKRPIGDKGPVGDKGETGDKGPTGDKGLNGDKGPNGDRGVVGPDGNQGPSGPVGLHSFANVFSKTSDTTLTVATPTLLSGTMSMVQYGSTDYTISYNTTSGVYKFSSCPGMLSVVLDIILPVETDAERSFVINLKSAADDSVISSTNVTKIANTVDVSRQIRSTHLLFIIGPTDPLVTSGFYINITNLLNADVTLSGWTLRVFSDITTTS